VVLFPATATGNEGSHDTPPCAAGTVPMQHDKTEQLIGRTCCTQAHRLSACPPYTVQHRNSVCSASILHTGSPTVRLSAIHSAAQEQCLLDQYTTHRLTACPPYTVQHRNSVCSASTLHTGSQSVRHTQCSTGTVSARPVYYTQAHRLSRQVPGGSAQSLRANVGPISLNQTSTASFQILSDISS
jgi:hypothetical protein